MSTFDRLHDPIIEEWMREWTDLREAGEKRDATDFLDVLVSLEDAAHLLLTFEEIKAQAVVRYSFVCRLLELPMCRCSD